MSAEDALMNYQKRVLESVKTSQKKNKKPEKDVEKACMAWFEAKGFSMHIIESKAVYNPKLGRYLKGQTVSGMSDSIGCTPDGIGCFVEFKAKGKKFTLKEHQRNFLTEKINRGCFAAVVDDVRDLEATYQHWAFLDQADKKRYLTSIMPYPKSMLRSDYKPLFD